MLLEHGAFVNLSRPCTAEVISPALAPAVINVYFDVVIVVWVADNEYKDGAEQFEVAN